MKSKDLLRTHYNKQYKFDIDQQKKINKIIMNGYPQNRYEAAVCLGKGSGKALEIAAGAGEVLVSLNDYYEEYIATDLSMERVRHLKKAFGDKVNIKIIQNDIEEQNLNFPPEYFDTIIMVAVIEHLLEPIAALNYCYSLLKQGGRILIYTPNIAKWTRRLKLLFGFFPSTGSQDEGFIDYNGKPVNILDDGHFHYFTFRALKKLLIERSNFKQVSYYGHGNSFLSRLFPEIFSECFVVGIK